MRCQAAVAIALFMTAACCRTLAAQPEFEIEFISAFGEFGTAPGRFNKPVGVALDAQGQIVVADNSNHRFQVCDPQGYCEAFGSEGTGPRQFKFSIGVAVDGQGRIAVSDAQNFRIHLWSPSGEWDAFGHQGSFPGQFRIPGGLAVDQQNTIIIADQRNHRVQICRDTGQCSAFGSAFGAWGSGIGEFDNPAAVAVDSQGRVLISDMENHRIQICNTIGDCAAFGQPGTAPGEFNHPRELTVDDQDRVIVADRDNHRIQVCELNGACAAFGEFGQADGQFRSPSGVAVDADDRVYVADRDNHRVQIFQAIYSGAPDPAPFQINAGLNDSWFNPATPGQGFFLTVFEDIGMIFLAWFTYDTERPPGNVESHLGEPGHRWLTAFGPYDGDTAVLDIELTRGGVFDRAEPMPFQQADGTITVEFSDCNTGLVNYDISSVGAQGEVPIERIALDNVPVCEGLE